MDTANLRLTIDLGALADNWRRLAHASGAAACGAAVKADAYGLGAVEIVFALARAGCRDFFVASWAEVAALGAMPDGARLAVLHGVQHDELATALESAAVPVLCTPAQVAAWRSATTRPCDVMVDTGINRLGLARADLGLLDGLAIDTLHSHLACAESPADPMNARQLAAFREVVAAVPARRTSLANSSGIMLGPDYAFGLTRPGIGLYGGTAGAVPVAGLAARVVQVRDIAPGDSVGYGATWIAARPTRVAVLNIGYADGYPRAMSNIGQAFAGDVACPVIGRVSMDLVAVDVTGADVTEGGWLRVDFDLVQAAAASGRSRYELLTGLGHRYAREYQ
ncbi:alanine racemase [Polymorphobacter sp. PAMC 29334]|uniref:alanine racemase n=1 Tax=Polymorphobacter sp. PAMC 29334 TaxID=2862331 RepID=UPI001C758CD8|nr:alanine racemase [Polymorphobacter sp. PAMC 29334]QYE35938.1 alanine racemase [Polymorphobacter sp. PAMC 29334]